MRTDIRIDIVVAVRNEERNLPVFVEAIRDLSLPDGAGVGMIFVEDSSSDATRSVLRDLASNDPLIQYYALEKGFGQGPAIVFGLSRSRADAMIMMDVDGSHPVEVIPEMIARHREGARLVQCRRKTIEGRVLYRTWGAALFNGLTRMITGFDPRTQSVYYRLIDADRARALCGEPLYWRFLRLPLAELQRTGALSVIEIDTIDRVHGASQYDFVRLAVLAGDGILSVMSFGRLLLCLLGVCGLALLLGWCASWWISLALLAFVLLTLHRRLMLASADDLTLMRVVESSQARSSTGGTKRE